MPPLLETLTSYVPGLILRRLGGDPPLPAGPEEERFAAAVLFADISGFTALTEQLARRGPAGAEELTAILNNYFGRLVAIITAHGGDVVKFAGDAIVAVWRADGGLEAAVSLAAQCGLAAQTGLEEVATAAAARLSMRVAVGAGEILAAQLGGTEDHWELLISGAPLVEVGHAGKIARPGDVVLSPGAWGLVEGRCRGLLIGETVGHGSVARLEAVVDPVPLHAAQRPSVGPHAEVALRTYIPGAILSRLDAGQTGWLAELRRVTVLFANLPGLDALAVGSIDRAHEVIRDAQRVIFQYEGTINKLHVDDKGACLLAAFGLPPLAHEDDAARGALAAVALEATLRARGIRGAIGVTTGRVFCGGIGSPDRREYTLMGDPVNVAARLMQATADEIRCDEATFQAARGRIGLEPLPPVQLKGKADPLPVFRPRRAGAGGEARNVVRSQRPLVGRVRELELLDRVLQDVRQGVTTEVLVIEGEAGIGKSRLVEEMMSRAEAAGFRVRVGSGDAIEKSASYHAWRAIFSQVFGLEPQLDPDARRARVIDQVRGHPELERLLPLLNAVLPLDLPDNEVTGQMTGQARADNIRDLLLNILQSTAARGPLLVVLEDGHWLDSASWALAAHVSHRVPHLALVISTRPLAEPLPVECARLLNAPGTRRIRLEALPPGDTVALVCQSLGVSSLPEPVIRLIREKADGHPFFSEELAFALRDAGQISIQGGVCRIAPGLGEMHDLNLPDTVEGVITSRIDRLEPSHQLTLKVASVIGRAFSLKVLHDVHPIDADRAQLSAYVGTLEALGLTPLETPEPDLTYLFRHAITQDVAYNLMSYAQRRQLHRRVGEWFEAAEQVNLAPFYPVLAHHWSLAGDDARTFEYLEKAGEQAYRTGADLEACLFFKRALALYADRGDASGIDADRRGRWERFLGDAQFGLGDVAGVLEHGTNALTLLGQRLPASKAAWSLRTVQQLLTHVLYTLLPNRLVVRGAEVVARRLEAARAAERLAEVYYFQNDPLRLVSVTLLAANLASGAGRLAPASRSFAIMGMVSGLARLHPIARRYFRKSQAITRESNDLRGLAIALYYEGVYGSGFGEWEEVDRVTGEALEICRRIGVNYETGICLTILGLSAYFTGRFEAGRQCFADLLTLARACSNVQHESWGLYAQAECIIPLGRFDEALELLLPARTLLEHHPDILSQTLCDSLLAVTHLRRGEGAVARASADAALARLRTTVPNNWASLEGYMGPPEVYLELWEQALQEGSSEVRELARLASEAIAAAKKFAQLYPIGQPRLCSLQARAYWLSGRERDARRAWRTSLTWAKRLRMPYEEALAHHEYGRVSPAGSPQRTAHLATAREIFERLGCAYHLARVAATP